jgi:glutamate synthase (NADPH/NADH) small chain
MVAEGLKIRTGVLVAGKDGLGKDSKVTNWAKETISPEQLKAEFDAVLLTGGAEQSRDLPVPGRDLKACTSRWSSCPSRTRSTRATSSRARSAPTASMSS